MKKIVIFFCILALLVPTVSFAGGHRNFHEGFHQGLGALAAVAVVGAVAHMVTYQPAYAYQPPPPPAYSHHASPHYASPYDEAYAHEYARLQQQAAEARRRQEIQQGIMDARRDFGYYR